ncbi:hypothetical protein [Echinicola pacifica]|nr:hypothetical protein [Echinicola pacifica]
MNLRLLNVLFSLTILFSCKESNMQENTFQENSIKISDVKTYNELLLDNAYDIELIPLSYSGSESIIINMENLYFFDSAYFIIDSGPRGEHSIKKFTQSGKFVKALNHLENNFQELPIEFVSSLGVKHLMALDKLNNFYILDKDLNITFHKELPFKAEKVKESDGKLFFFANKRAINQQPDSLMYNFIVTDMEVNIINKFDPFTISSHSTNVTISTTNSFTNTGQLLWVNAISDTIFNIQEDGMHPAFKVDFQIPPFKKKDYPEVNPGSLYPMLIADFSWGISDIIKTDSYLFFMFREKGSLKLILFDAKSRQSYTIEESSGDTVQDVIPWPRTSLNNELYGWMGERNIAWVDNWNERDKNSILVKVHNHVKENINPVLIKYKFKL